MATCPSCGTENQEGAKFCNECGTKIQAVRVRDQRRVCTIVFCDLVGFTQRSEQLDPEDVRRFLVPYYELMQEEVTRYGGVIDKLYGDGALAVFGVPIAHEDDPERAIRASLRVLERLPDLGLDLQARIGVNTGETIVSIDHAARGDALTGDTVNTASRIQSAAPVGTVAVGELTHAATTHVFDYEVLEPVELKGKVGRIPIFRPIAPIASIGGEPPPDSTPFLGRDAELARLIEAFETSRKGKLTFLTIIAEPGVGKSRLVREFSRYVDDLPDLITWRQGRCLPYGEGISFWALSEIVKSHAGVMDTDDQATLSSRLDQVLTEPDVSTRRWMKDRLAPLIGLEISTEPPEHQELFTAWRRFVVSIASAGPAVLVFEDLHWADAALVEFLAFLGTSDTDLPLLLLATARPEVSDRYPEWPGRGDALRLGPLPGDAMRRLVESTLAGASDTLLEIVLERAGGSPLYAEQFAAMRRTMPIAGGSDDDLPIPPTVHALLAARIDMLPSVMKDTVQNASVMGKSFWAGSLAELGERDAEELMTQLTELVARELIRREAASSIEGEDEYSFIHALVRDVAYAELPRASRMAKHRTAAAWITERVGRPLGEVGEIVVSHLDRAKDAAVAAGLTDDVATIDVDLVEPLLDAGAYAERIDMRIASDHLGRAVDLLDDGDPRRAPVLSSLANAVAAAGDFNRAEPACEAAIGSARAAGDLDAMVKGVLAKIGVLEGLDRDPLELLEAAYEELQRYPAGEGLLAIASNLALYQAGYGTIDRALAWIAEAKRIATEIGGSIPSKLLEAEGMVMLDQGNPAGEGVMREAFQVALDAGAVEDAAWVLNDTAANLPEISGYEGALDAIIASRAFAQDRGFDPSMGVDYLLYWEFELGMWDRVLDEAPALLEQMVALGADHGVLAIKAIVTKICVERGGEWLGRIDTTFLEEDGGSLSLRMAQAGIRIRLEGSASPSDLEPFEERIAAGQTFGPSLYEIDGLITAGRPDVANSVFQRWVEFHATIAHKYLCARAMLAAALGDPQEARPLLIEAIGLSRSLVARQTEACLLPYLARCEIAIGESDRARSNLLASRALWERMGASVRIERVDEALADIAF